ncbi:thiol-disulfide oxidoreductase DCC family protein, partial [Streptomyces sp. NRRL B-24484]|uniref:thiol-disulfide oxidoreductase DCC family protein n=1 Tax=Streptomyces sp. NRRL B-24484 TaxID=1463833 RepID=UPI0004C09844
MAEILRVPVLLFDGDCAMCTGWVAWAERYPGAVRSSGEWEAVAYQFVDLAALDACAGGQGLVTAERVQHGPLWLTPSGRLHVGPEAAARVLMRSGGAWPYVGGLLALPPVRMLARILCLPAMRRWHPTRTGGSP